MLAECITYRNPKNGDTLESRFTSDEVIEILAKLTSNDFARSLVANFERRGGLSEAQWYWGHKLAHENNPHLDCNIKEWFRLDCNIEEWLREAYKDITIKRLMWKIDEKARIKLFINPERIDVVFSGGDYARRVGYIEKDQLFPKENCPKTVIAQIMVFSKYKMDFMKVYGKQWGVCFVCGRQLENEESVRNGIGPICAGRFGA